MRPPLSSRSLAKPRGSKIRACPHSDMASSYSDDVIAFEVKKIEKSLPDFSNFLR